MFRCRLLEDDQTGTPDQLVTGQLQHPGPRPEGLADEVTISHWPPLVLPSCSDDLRTNLGRGARQPAANAVKPDRGEHTIPGAIARWRRLGPTASGPARPDPGRFVVAACRLLRRVSATASM